MKGYRFTFGNSFDSIPNTEKVDKCRNALLGALETSNKEMYQAFNFRGDGFPDVIYQKPYKETWSIYAKDGSEASYYLDKLIAHFFKFPLLIGNQLYKLEEFHEIRDIRIIPSKTNEKIHYKLITPLLLFTKNHFPMFVAINKRHGKDANALEIELKSASSRLIISNLKFQLQQQLKYKPFHELNNVDIEWIDFKIRFGEFHKDEKPTPMIFGSFTSTYELPRFIGQKIGKGFGQINNIKRGGEE